MKVVIGNSAWQGMLQASLNQGYAAQEHRIYAIDPGQTTGIAHFGFVAPSRMELLQLDTQEAVAGYEAIKDDIVRLSQPPEVIVCEDYKVYGWKADDHKWASLHTPQLIGAIKVLAYQLNIPIVFQMAIQAKQFVTDPYLERMGWYTPGMKHARDAQRHALYYKMFGKKDKDKASA